MHRPIGRIALVVVCISSVAGPSRAEAQQSSPDTSAMAGMMTTPLDIPMDRMGSGTTWVPDAAPIASLHRPLGGWDITGHGFAFAQYNAQGGPRGDQQFGSVNWAMVMASHMVGTGMIQFRSMLSLDVLGVGGRGYPVLLQSGELYHGIPIHDRQHPHDVFMELSALYLQPITKKLGLELYAAPSGEPALGPVAFMHRPSAMDDPIAPIGHHWQDATHISFGVGTAGLFTRQWKIEGSIFNGREPDDNRWNFDFGKLDSYSGRITFNPDSHWSMTAGYGRLLMSEDSMHRVTASILHGAPLGKTGQWATSLIYGANQELGRAGWSHSILLESEAELDQTSTLFGRAEFVQKSAADLVLTDSAAGFSPGRRFNVGTVSLGYMREIAHGHSATVGLGIRGAVDFVPGALTPFYGSRTPVSAVLFLRVRPSHQSPPMDGMAGMQR